MGDHGKVADTYLLRNVALEKHSRIMELIPD